MVALIADGGEITVGRQMATYVYGAWEVNAPDDVEEEERDDRLDWGFIYRPDNRPTGRFDLAFVRADASMDMELGKSDTEQVIDTATKRVSGDVFFEREISGAGLGRWVPGKHFRTGDIVDVRLWWRTLALPVTAIDLATKKDEPLGYAVHVGGQVIADAEKLRQHNDKIEQQIAADRRKAEKANQETRRRADRAQATADSIRQDLGEPDGSVGGLFGEYLDKLGEDGDVTQDLLRINGLLWDEQHGWNATQEAINEQQAKINELTEGRLDDQERILEALREAQRAALKETPRIFYAQRANPQPEQNAHWQTNIPSSAGPSLTARGQWSGQVYIHHSMNATTNHESQIYHYPIPLPDGSRTINLPSLTGSNYAVKIDYLIDQAIQRERNLVTTDPWQLPGSTWTVDDRHTFTVPRAGRIAIWYRVTWQTPQTLVNYGIDITCNGQWIKATGLRNYVFPATGHGLQILTNDAEAVFAAGDVIEFRAFSASNNTVAGRTASRVETKITWVEEIDV